MAEAHFGEPVTRAVITIPAWYDAAQRQATKDAAQIAGLTVLRLLSEPTAAALGHGAHRGADRRYLVCDLGGGTFDVAAVDVEAGIFEVLATTGDAFLGGDDVDRADRREPRARRARSARLRHHRPTPIADRAAARSPRRRTKHELSDVAVSEGLRPRARPAAVGQGASSTAEAAAPRRARAVVGAADPAASRRRSARRSSAAAASARTSRRCCSSAA